MNGTYNYSLARMKNGFIKFSLITLVVLLQVKLLMGQGATLTISQTKLVDFKGWGLMPAPIDRQMPTYSDGSKAWGDVSWLPTSGSSANTIHKAVCDLSFDIARVYFSPTIGKNDHTLDMARLQDLKDHLTLLKNQGIPNYVVTIWSPPAYMKTPDAVRYGKYNDKVQSLNPIYADGEGYDYADYLVDVLKALRSANFKMPLSISIQNEPDVAQVYDGCSYTETTAGQQLWRNVVKALRSKLDQNQMNGILIIGTEDSGYDGITKLLGTPSLSGFSQMNADVAFRDALGGFAIHTYYTSGKIRTLNLAIAKYPGKDLWMTEYSTDGGIRTELRPNSGNSQMNWTLNFVRRMAADIVDFKTSYWFFWRGWHSSSSADDQDLVYGSGQKTKAYYVFQKLWKTTGPGWKVMTMTSDDPQLRTDNTKLINSGSGDMWSAPVDLLAMQDSLGSTTCLMLVNNYSYEKTIQTINGLKGSEAYVFISDPTHDMADQAVRTVTAGKLDGGGLSLPPYSVTFLITKMQTSSADGISNRPDKLKVVPNPAGEQTTVYSESIIRTVTLLSAAGTVIKTMTVNQKNLDITTADLSPGVYFLYVKTDQGKETIRFVRR